MKENDIMIRRKIKAKSIDKAMRVIKAKYPFARMITYKFDKDFKYDLEKDWDNRTMSVAFIKDFRKIKELI